MSSYQLHEVSSESMIPAALMDDWKSAISKRSTSSITQPLPTRLVEGKADSVLIQFKGKTVGFLVVHIDSASAQAEIMKCHLNDTHHDEQTMISILNDLELRLTKAGVQHVLVNLANCYTNLDLVFSKLNYQLIPNPAVTPDVPDVLVMEKRLDLH